MGEVTREIFGNIPASQQLLFYWVASLSIVIFVAGLVRRTRRWMHGASHGQFTRKNLWRRTQYFMTQVFSQPRLRKEPSAGINHLLIFWGVMVLFIGTILIALEHHTPLEFFHGFFYLIFSLTTDFFGLLLVLGVGMAVYRRYWVRPERRHKNAYAIPLLLLGLLGVTGFLLEGLRMARLGSYWFDWSPVGALVAILLNSSGVTEQVLATVHRGTWWFHSLLNFVFIALLPSSQMLHTVAALLNVFFSTNDRPKGSLTTPFLLKDLESGTVKKPVPETAGDLSRTQLLSLDACTECGLCDTVCPAFIAGRSLSPQSAVLEMRNHLDVSGKAGWRTPLEEIISSDEAWSCTSCRACMEACPVSIQHIDLLVDVRRALVMTSRLDPNMATTLEKLRDTGNPFGLPKEQRLGWTAGLPAGVRVKQAQADGNFDVLFWVGCAGAFDNRAQRVSRAVATTLSRADVRFAVLGPREYCTGDAARRLGEEGLFQQMVSRNVATLNECGVCEIVTACPHCLNTLKNEYPEFGGNYNVSHYSEFVLSLVNEGRLILNTSGETRPLTYHDACYLGRHNGVYNQPRDLLAATKAVGTYEMPRNRERSFCCGAGGSNAWYEMREGKRINSIRYAEAKETGAELLVTACPFCNTMFDEIAGGQEPETRLEIQDLAEIVERASRC
jgi:Fe-S oxidoreductase